MQRVFRPHGRSAHEFCAFHHTSRQRYKEVGHGEMSLLPFIQQRCLWGDSTLCMVRERGGRHDGGGFHATVS